MEIIKGVAKPHLWLPVRLKPKGQRKFQALFIPGVGYMGRNEVREVLHWYNERNGTDYTIEMIDEQLEQRQEGVYNRTPSLRRYLATGDWFSKPLPPRSTP